MNLNFLGHLSVAPITGGYRGYFGNFGQTTSTAVPCKDPAGSPIECQIMSAASSDLLVWTAEADIRVGGPAWSPPASGPALAGTADQVFALKRSGSTCVTLFFNRPQDPNSKTIHYSTAPDGVTFTNEYVLDNAAGTFTGQMGANILDLPDGSWAIYTDARESGCGGTCRKFHVNYSQLIKY